MKDIKKGTDRNYEKGSMSVFVIVAFLFSMSILIKIYWSNTNYQLGVLQAEQRIQEIYSADLERMDEIHNYIIANSGIGGEGGTSGGTPPSPPIQLFEIYSLDISLQPGKKSIKVNVTSVNGDTKDINNGKVEYKFIIDGTELTQYQTLSSYTIENLYGNVEGQTYNVTVEAKDETGKSIQVTKSAETTCLNTTYYRNTANELLCTVSGRPYYKVNDKGAIAGMIYYANANNWLAPLLVSTDETAVAYNALSTDFSSLGSLNYNGTTYYYSSMNYWMSPSGGCNTQLTFLNSEDNYYTRIETAVRDLLDAYYGS